MKKLSILSRAGIAGRRCRHRLYSAALATLLLTASCTNELLHRPLDNPTLPEGAIALNLSVEGESLVNTRASLADESKIHNLTVGVYNPTTGAKIEICTATQTGSQWYIRPSTWDPNTQADVVVVANLSTDEQTDFTAAANLTAAQAVTSTAITATPANIATNGIIMSSIQTRPAGSGVAHIMGNLVRLYAKISVDATGAAAQSSPDPTFALLDVQLWNAAQEGYLMAPASLPTDLGGTATYTTITATTNKVEDLIYLHENAGTAANPTKLIVKGTYDGVDYFYRIDIAYPTSDTDKTLRYDIVRNTHYVVNITKVKNPGHATAALAAAAPRSNAIDYTITIPSTAGADAVGDGYAYIAIDHSEAIIYKNLPWTSTGIVTLSYKAPTSMGNCTVTPTGTGLSIASGALPATDGSDQTAIVRINATASFTTGQLIFRLGTLEKRLTITARPALRPWQSELADFATAQYTLLRRSANSNIRYSAFRTTHANANTSTVVLQPVDAPFFYAPTFELNSPSANETFKLLDRTNGNTVMVVIVQENVTTFTTLPQFYVGAFWRNAEKGERLIRQESASITLYNGAWEAHVCEGLDLGIDQVRLDTDFPTSFPMNDEDSESATAVTTGTSLISTGNIKFRIGLTEENPNLAVAGYPRGKPRYGVVLVKHAGGYSPIYLRQGEEDDYVGGTEVKWSPFNVNTVGTFTAYPSQAGYFKQYNKSYSEMFVPQTSAPGSTWRTTTTETEIFNVCPNSYSIPTANGVYTNTATNINKGDINEMGSLFNGTNAGTGTANHIWGYYADGFFDRHAIVNSATGFANSSVKFNSPTVAYHGYLYVNTSTYASLFLPAAGRRGNSGGTLGNAGGYGLYWSSSINGTNSRYLYFDSTNASQGTTDRTYGFSVRCIR